MVYKLEPAAVSIFYDDAPSVGLLVSVLLKGKTARFELFSDLDHLSPWK